MKKVSNMNHEKLRLAELRSYSIMDTVEEEEYENITNIASSICETPVSLISFVDDKRQWFKSRKGLDVTETPVEYAFCRHAINSGNEIYIVEDSRESEIFYMNPLVTSDPYVIFYAGVPLQTIGGYKLGTLCVIDHEPRRLSMDQQKSLLRLAKVVSRMLELRKKSLALEETLANKEAINKDLEQFAYVVAHDIRSPLNRISSLAKLISDEVRENAGVKPLLDAIDQSASKLNSFVSGVLEYSKSEKLSKFPKEIFALNDFFEELENDMVSQENVRFYYDFGIEKVNVNKVALKQIFMNLISNSIKYNQQEVPEIRIKVAEVDDYFQFTQRDNGPGIPEGFLPEIFSIFKIAGIKDRYGKTGNGIGLATVKRLVQAQEGMICVKSARNRGTSFSFAIMA